MNCHFVSFCNSSLSKNAREQTLRQIALGYKHGHGSTRIGFNSGVGCGGINAGCI